MAAMSEAIAFDTHRFVKNLTDHGFTEEQAEVLANEQVNLLNSNLSTKTDIALIQQDIEALRQATKTDIALIHRDIEALRKETKADIEALRQATKTDIEALRQATKTDIEALRQATKTDIALIHRDIEVLRKETKADIANLKSDLLKWMFGALIAQGGVIVTLIVAFSRSSSP